MMINRKNYEQVFIDYFDGRLSPVDTACLMAFLEENPDIREEFESFEEIRLDTPGNFAFHDKHTLKRRIIPEGDHITEDNYLQVFFSEVEGTMDEEMKLHLKSFLHRNPSLEREYYSWRNAHLIPDAYVFDRKAKLKRSVIFPFTGLRREYAFAGMAATLALLVVAGILLFRNLETQTRQGMAPGQVQALHEIRQSHKPTSDNIESPGITQDSWLADQQRKNEKNSPRTVQQPLLAQADQVIEKMKYKTNRQITESANEQVPEQLTAYMNEYTQIMQYYDLRERNKQQQPEEPRYADNRSNADNNNFNRARLTFWDFAEYGVAGYNAIADKDIKYKRRINSDGRTSAVTLGSFAFEKK